MSSRIYISILFFTIILLTLFLFKPSLMFDASGSLKKFDYENHSVNSLFSLEIIIPFIAILCYFITLLLELIII